MKNNDEFLSMVDRLSSMPDRFEAIFNDIPSAWHCWEPACWDGIPGERFSAVAQACHLRDIEIDGYHDRFARTLSEDCPALVSLDGYALAEARRYDAENPIEALAAFRAARLQTVALLKQCGQTELERQASFGAHGEVDLRELIDLLHSHDLQHLACMQWLLIQIVQSGQKTVHRGDRRACR